MVDQPLARASAVATAPAPALDHLPEHGSAVGMRTWAAMRSRAFRFYWGSSMAQMGAMNVQQMVQPWLVYEITGSSAMLGAASLAGAIPMLALSPLGGYLADRFPKKNLLMVGQAASVVLALVLGVGITLGFVSAPLLLVAAALQGASMAIMMPARQAMVVEIVPRKDLSNAVALNNTGMNANRVMAPAFTGFLIAVLGPASGYYVTAVLFVIAALMTAQLPKSPASGGREGFLQQMGGAVTYVRDDRTILAILMVTLGGVLLSMPYMALLPAFAKEVLAVGPLHLGLLMTASGVGALVASLAIASMRDHNRGLWYLGSMLLLGVALVGFTLSHSYALALLFIVPIGIGQAGRMAYSNILVQAYVQDGYRGRVMSFFMMEFGLTSLSTFAVALLADAVGIAWALGATGALLVVFTLAAYRLVPRLARLQ
ncbi:MAG: MFS transporter [Dehalococcoidia bacterium]|nr:MFS transporter [Dehalococcoidia bacterium]